MKKILLLLSLLTVLATPLSAQAVGTWRTHLSYSEIEKTVYAGSRIFVLASGGLYSYNPSDGSLQTYDKATVLSDCGISDIEWSTQEGRLLIIYDNYNIDIMDADGNVVNIADYKDKTMAGDKTVYNITMNDRYAYLSTGFGILKINLADASVSDTYNLSQTVYDTEIISSIIYAATPDGILQTPTTGNPTDKNQWSRLSVAGFRHLFRIDDKLAAANNGEIATVNTTDGTWTMFYTPWFLAVTQQSDGHILCYGSDHSYIIRDTSGGQDLPFRLTGMAHSAANDTYWVGTEDGFLANVSIDDDATMTYHVTNLRPDGPESGYFGFMRHTDGRLYTVGGYNDNERKAGVQVYDDATGWTVFDDSFASTLGYTYNNSYAIAIDPKDETHTFMASQTGLYEFRNGSLAAKYNMDNSPLRPAATVSENFYRDYTIVSSVAYDADGLLWVANSFAEDASLFSFDGSNWTSHHHDEFISTDGYSLGRMLDMTYDSLRGSLWIGSNDWRKPVLACYDIANDQVRLFDNHVNQNGTAFTTYSVTDPTIDREGNVWVATDAGPFVITASMIANGDNYFNQIIVPRNDGSGYGDYLLSGVPITSIAIDGAGRKWFGTSNNGVYLISADNMTQVEHFTADNSTLLSDNVEAIAINPDNGEVFFGTASGLCSYMSGVSRPAEEMTKDGVYAYPNPVRPDYEGVITITGLTLDADIKIVTVNGTLVNEGRSTGGTYSWDGRDGSGRRVASGIYMVQTATSDGSKGTVCKIAVVN